MFKDRYSTGQQFLRPDALPRTDGVLFTLAQQDPTVELMYYPDAQVKGGRVGPYVTDEAYVRLCFQAKPLIPEEDWTRVALHMPRILSEAPQ